MLHAPTTYLKEHNISNFIAANSNAEHLPFSNGIPDYVFTFNAVHHFNLLGFYRRAPERPASQKLGHI
jgi:hypothetical protein